MPAIADEQSLHHAIAAALTDGALPGELEGMDEEALRAAARFVAGAVARRRPGEPAICLESVGTEGTGAMRLLVNNDDMPFLVDSTAAVIAEHDVLARRLLHPVVAAERDEEGRLLSLRGRGEDGGRGSPESIIYMELERADARARRAIIDELERNLAHVRLAVGDWETLRAAMEEDAAAARDAETAELLRWFAGGAFTLLGRQLRRPGGSVAEPLGVLRAGDVALWSDDAAAEAAALLRDEPARGVLLLKADARSTVHRAAPLDLVVVPRGADGTLSIHAGLWTSAALATPPAKMPVLRERLRRLGDKLRFDPRGHAGKALAHALTILPHDLLVALPEDAVEELAITEMSLADRPRPAIVLAADALGRHLHAFAWVPRDELNTGSRLAIADLLKQETGAALLSWSVEAGEAETALIRYAMARAPGAALPSGAALTHRLDALLRGWGPAVGEALVERVGAARAARLSLRTIDIFPPVYRAATEPAQAAEDVLRLAGLGPDDRQARLFEAGSRLHLKTYRRGGLIALSDAVPALENFGFRVLEEFPTALGEDGREGHIHDFTVEPIGGSREALLARGPEIEEAVAAVLAGRAENDPFNALIVGANLDPFGVTILRAAFRYLRQTGLPYGLQTVVDALRRAPDAARELVALFHALHDPAVEGDREAGGAAGGALLDEALAAVSAIDDDRILRRLRSFVEACLRTNAFVRRQDEAFAFKLRSADVPGLPAPVPWREVWIYSARLEGIHLRGGPVARGGLRWSDRRDDFRTEILGLMKAQVVKNAVIVPTGAKGGFYPKMLPSAADRDAWLAEGTEAYRIFIRSLLSLTDNLVEGRIVHPAGVVIRDDDDPYFVVAADKGTASFSDTANGLALERGFWLGDAFASGGSHGYDHKAMGITAKGAWLSVQRHFAERGKDVQRDPLTVAGVGDMSGDVFGNGMLLSRAILLRAAFDHRHIFLDPSPDAEAAFVERERQFGLPRSSWADYDASLISEGGGVFPRTQKSIPLSPEVRAMLGTEAEAMGPTELMQAILRMPTDLLWFGGIGTYVKGSDENHVEVGDPANDALRVDGRELRATAVGEGANLALTMAGRIEFAAAGGRINTDFIDNSAGVDCSDNEVNIKIPLNREMAEGRLAQEDRDALLAEMTDEVASLVLEDNRLQTLALSIAEVRGAGAVPQYIQLIGQLEASGHLNRAVEGLDADEELLRRVSEGRGLTRPELAVLLSTTKLALQDALQAGALPDDPLLEDDLLRAFPRPLRERHGDALLGHRLRREIVSTKVANRLVNRLGLTAAFALAEEEGVGLGAVATGFVAAERLFDVAPLWDVLDRRSMSESLRIELFREVARALRLHISDILRAMRPEEGAGALVARLRPGLNKLLAAGESLLRAETRRQAEQLRERLAGLGAPADIVEPVVRVVVMNGAVGIAALGHERRMDEVAVTHAYTRLGEVLGLDWAQGAASRYQPADPWERLLTAGLERDFEQLRLEFLERVGATGRGDAVEEWIEGHAPRIAQFRALVDRARAAPVTTAPMLAQVASQARVLLSR